MIDRLKQLFTRDASKSEEDQIEEFTEKTQLDDSIIELLLAELIDSNDFYELKKLVENKILLLCVLKSTCLTENVLKNLDEMVHDAQFRKEVDKTIFTFYDYVSSKYEGKSLKVLEVLKELQRTSKKV